MGRMMAGENWRGRAWAGEVARRSMAVSDGVQRGGRAVAGDRAASWGDACERWNARIAKECPNNRPGPTIVTFAPWPRKHDKHSTFQGGLCSHLQHHRRLFAHRTLRWMRCSNPGGQRGNPCHRHRELMTWNRSSLPTMR
jgi:hypothetical protein